VQYRLTQAPITYYACHCTDCQRRSGSAMRLVMVVSRSALEVTQGAPELRSFPFGRKQRRARLCADCDTRLWAEPEDQPQTAIVLPGTLHQAREFTPVAHLWTKSALPWIALPPGAVCYEEGPAQFSELVRLWQQATSTSTVSAKDPP
jgi:hypothetical protein